VFINGFLEVEPFAAILITHGTHGHSQEFVAGGTCDWGLKERPGGAL